MKANFKFSQNKSKQLYAIVLLLVLGFYANLVSMAQTKPRSLTDSLTSLFAKSTDIKERIKLAIDLSTIYSSISIDSCLKYAEEAVQLSENTDWMRGKCRAYSSKGIACFYAGDLANASSAWKRQLAHAQKYLSHAKLKEDVDKAHKEIFSSYANLGLISMQQDSHHIALNYHAKSLTLVEELQDTSNQILCLINLGVDYFNLGNYPKALENLFKSLRILESKMTKNHEDQSSVGSPRFLEFTAAAYGSLGNVYMREENDSLAQLYYEKSLEYSRRIGDKYKTANQLINLGLIRIRQKKTELALDFFEEADGLNKEIGNVAGSAICLNNMSGIYSEKRDYKKALDFYLKALDMDKEIMAQMGMATRYTNIGNTYSKLGNFQFAQAYLDSASAKLNAIKAIHYELEYEEIRSAFHDTLGGLALNQNNYVEAASQFQKALLHAKQQNSIKDTLFNESKSKDIGKLEANHEIEMDELRRKHMEAEQRRIAQGKEQRRNNLQYTGILIGIVALLSFVLLMGRFRIPIHLAEAITFILFLILFEFLLVLLDPYTNEWTGDVPIWKLLLNVALAALVFPMHQFLENVLKRRMLTFLEKKSPENHIDFKILIIWFSLGSILLGNSSPSLFMQSEKSNSESLFKIKIDSLNTEFRQAADDTSRVKILLQLSKIYYNSNPDSAFEFNQKAFALANRINWKMGLGNVHKQLGWYHYLDGKYKSAIAEYKQGLEFYTTINYSAGISVLLNRIGIIYTQQGHFREAIKQHSDALSLASDLLNHALQDKNSEAIIQYKMQIAKQLGNIANGHHGLSDYVTALEFNFKALELDQELANSRGRAIRLGNIGGIYLEQGKYAKALEYLNQALAIDRDQKNKIGIARHLGNIGIVHEELGNYADALKSYEQSLEMNREIGNNKGITIRLTSIGTLLQRNRRFAQASEHYFDALDMAKEIGNKRGIAILLGNIGSLRIQQGIFDDAEQYLLQGAQLCDSIGALYEQMKIENIASQLNDTLGIIALRVSNYVEATHRFQKALQHHKLFLSVKDSLFNEGISKDMGKLEAKHEHEMNELQRVHTEAERIRLEEGLIARRNMLQYSGIFISIVILLSFVLLLGKFKVPVRFAEAIVFILFLIIFEFVLVLTDPYVDLWTGGVPAWKLLLNVLLAGLVFPLHQFLEKLLKRRMIKSL